MTCTEEAFLKSVATHAMQVLRADGIYRHLRFRQPAPNAWLHHFELITWPGHLCMTGACGAYVSARLDCTSWDRGFVWCLYAIAWGIRQFDAQVPAEKAKAA